MFVLLLIVCYKRSFVLTLTAQNELEIQEQQLEAANHAGNDIEVLQMQITQLNKQIGKSGLESDKVQQKILGTISSLSKDHGTKLDLLERTHTYQTVDFTIYSNQIAVEGGFNGILGLAYEMENEFDYARLTNLSLYKEKDHSTKKTRLYGKFLFQHFKQL
jgi:hypothetical protein